MKTAMQDLIDKVEHAISYNVEGGLVEKYTWTELFNDMELALEKEKEQIIEIANKARETTVENSIWGFKYNPEEIYSQYNQNK